jgi:hypothetical protein
MGDHLIRKRGKFAPSSANSTNESVRLCPLLGLGVSLA